MLAVSIVKKKLADLNKHGWDWHSSAGCCQVQLNLQSSLIVIKLTAHAVTTTVSMSTENYVSRTDTYYWLGQFMSIVNLLGFHPNSHNAVIFLLVLYAQVWDIVLKIFCFHCITHLLNGTTNSAKISFHCFERQKQNIINLHSGGALVDVSEENMSNHDTKLKLSVWLHAIRGKRENMFLAIWVNWSFNTTVLQYIIDNW